VATDDASDDAGPKHPAHDLHQGIAGISDSMDVLGNLPFLPVLGIYLFLLVGGPEGIVAQFALKKQEQLVDVGRIGKMVVVFVLTGTVPGSICAKNYVFSHFTLNFSRITLSISFNE